MARENKESFDKRARHSVLEVGDKVLVRNMKERGGPGKLRSHWEKCVYLVKERKEDGPVYVVEPERGGVSRCLHRNLLFPVGNELKLEEAGTFQRQKEEEEIRQRGNAEKSKKALEEENRKITTDVSSEDEEGDSEPNSSDESSDIQEKEKKISKKRIRKPTKRFTYDELGTPTISKITKVRTKYLEALKEIENAIQTVTEMLESENKKIRQKNRNL